MLKALEENPELSKRQLAKQHGISLGKANYSLSALMDKGWIKTRNFRKSQNRLAYAYVFTPSVLRRKGQLTFRFLERKRREFDTLRREIAALDAELNSISRTEDDNA
jgi:EPS-associated MarR family transcriptional regulator